MLILAPVTVKVTVLVPVPQLAHSFQQRSRVAFTSVAADKVVVVHPVPGEAVRWFEPTLFGGPCVCEGDLPPLAAACVDNLANFPPRRYGG